jgi:hypothetical protein
MISPAMFRSGAFPTTATTRYVGVASGTQVPATSETTVVTAVPADCTLANLRVMHPSGTAPGVGNTWTITVRKNLADTALKVTLTDAQSDASDHTNTASFVAGDRLSFSITTTTAGTNALPGASPAFYVEFSGTGQPVFTGDDTTFTTTSGTRYLAFQQSPLLTAALSSWPPIPTPGTVDRFTFRINPALTGTNTITATLVKNGTDVYTMTPDLAAGVLARVDTTTSPISVAAGDQLFWRLTNTSSTATRISISTRFNPTTDGEAIVLGGTNAAPTNANTNYYYGPGIWTSLSSTESQRQVVVDANWMTRKLVASIGAAAGSGFSWNFTERKSGVSQTVLVVIANPATTGSDTVDSAPFVPGDLFSMNFKGSGVGANLAVAAQYGVVLYRTPGGGTLWNSATVSFDGLGDFAGQGRVLYTGSAAVSAGGYFLGFGNVLSLDTYRHLVGPFLGNIVSMEAEGGIILSTIANGNYIADRADGILFSLTPVGHDG